MESKDLEGGIMANFKVSIPAMTWRDKKTMKTLNEDSNLAEPSLQETKHGQEEPKSLLVQAIKPTLKY